MNFDKFFISWFWHKQRWSKRDVKSVDVLSLQFQLFLKVVFNIVLKICHFFVFPFAKVSKRGFQFHIFTCFLFLSGCTAGEFFCPCPYMTGIIFQNYWEEMRKFFLGQLWSIFYDVVVFRHPPSCAVFFFFWPKYLINVCGHGQWNRQGFKIS